MIELPFAIAGLIVAVGIGAIVGRLTSAGAGMRSTLDDLRIQNAELAGKCRTLGRELGQLLEVNRRLDKIIQAYEADESSTRGAA